MKFLAIEKEIEGFASDDFKPFLEPEAKHVWELYQKDIIREIYFNDQHNAVIIFEAESMDIVKNIIEEFPLVKNRLIKFDIMELKPYTGFSRLIDGSA